MAGYDAGRAQLVVALGMLPDGSLTAGIWVYDTATGAWACAQGEESTCALKARDLPYGPGKRAFSAYQQVAISRALPLSLAPSLSLALSSAFSLAFSSWFCTLALRLSHALSLSLHTLTHGRWG